MALTSAEWANFRKDVDLVVEAVGQCIVLLDGNFEPVCELPPVVSLSAGDTSLEAAETSLEVPATTPRGITHHIVEALIDKGFGKLDESSKLKVEDGRSWFLMVQRRGGEAGRIVSKITFPKLATEGYEVTGLRLEAASLISLLEFWPCPSVPTIWGHEPVREWTEDAAGPYSRPYKYAPIEVATVARGYTALGPAEEIIRTMVQESLDAGNRAQGFTRPHMVVDFTPTGRVSPEVAIRREDRTIWETISEPARLAGVDVAVDLWLPGDKPLTVKYEAGGVVKTTWPSDQPVLVCKVKQLEGVS
ncbi:hypothetical protein ACMXZU_04655 [Corynebacterium striatum]